MKLIKALKDAAHDLNFLARCLEEHDKLGDDSLLEVIDGGIEQVGDSNVELAELFLAWRQEQQKRLDRRGMSLIQRGRKDNE